MSLTYWESTEKAWVTPALQGAQMDVDVRLLPPQELVPLAESGLSADTGPDLLGIEMADVDRLASNLQPIDIDPSPWRAPFAAPFLRKDGLCALPVSGAVGALWACRQSRLPWPPASPLEPNLSPSRQ